MDPSSPEALLAHNVRHVGLWEPCDAKAARTDLMGGKLARAYLSNPAWSPLRVPINGEVRDLDVDSRYPRGAVAAKGVVVRHPRPYVSWVQNVVRQFGFYPFWHP